MPDGINIDANFVLNISFSCLMIRLTASLLFLFAMVSCNPNGTLYYATKWIWNKKLKEPVTIKLSSPYYADLQTSGGGPYQYIDEHTAEEYERSFDQDVYKELNEHPYITLVPIDQDYELVLTSVILSESISSEWCDGQEFFLSSCDVDMQYTLYDREGNEVKSSSLSVTESENLKDSENDDGSVDCNVKDYSIDFENLLSRLADKVEAQVTNNIVRHLKKN